MTKWNEQCNATVDGETSFQISAKWLHLPISTVAHPASPPASGELTYGRGDDRDRIPPGYPGIIFSLTISRPLSLNQYSHDSYRAHYHLGHAAEGRTHPISIAVEKRSSPTRIHDKNDWRPNGPNERTNRGLLSSSARLLSFEKSLQKQCETSSSFSSMQSYFSLPL